MNNDIKDVRELLAPANPSPPGSLAGSSRDGFGQAAFARVTASGTTGPRRARRTGVRLVAVGGLAVTLAAGVTVAQNLGGVDENGKPRPLPGVPAGPVANAQEALNRAATAAQSKPFAPPRPGQWSYTETRHERAVFPDRGKVLKPGTQREKVLDRSWMRADGLRSAAIENGKLVESPTGGSVVPPTDYATLARLPRDPDALLAHVRDRWKSPKERDSTVFALLSGTLAKGVLPNAQEAAIYRAMAKVPGVTLTRGTTDIQGRPVLTVSHVSGGWLRQDVLLDPRTYAYRGHRSVAVKDHTDGAENGGWTMRKGTVESQSALLAAGTVDRPGQRP